MKKTIYYIGGSPCSGKSTLAERLAEAYGMYYFKVDDHLEKYMQLAAQAGCASCQACQEMTPEDIWMRDPQVQCDEELRIYQEIWPFVQEDLTQLDASTIVTEGAAYLPTLMQAVGAAHYLAIVPSADFQVSHYRQREWVPYVLEGCSDKEKAFDNWMQRDILFALRIWEMCEGYQLPCMVTDGTKTPEEVLCWAKGIFGL